MPEHVYTVVARAHSIDTQTNAMILFQIIERIVAPALPARIREFTVVTSWRRESGDEGVSFTQQVRLTDPQQEAVVQFDSSFSFERISQRVITAVTGLAFQQSGLHRVEVYLRKADEQDWGNPVASYPVDVVAGTQASEDSLLSSGATDSP